MSQPANPYADYNRLLKAEKLVAWFEKHGRRSRAVREMTRLDWHWAAIQAGVNEPSSETRILAQVLLRAREEMFERFGACK